MNSRNKQARKIVADENAKKRAALTGEDQLRALKRDIDGLLGEDE